MAFRRKENDPFMQKIWKNGTSKVNESKWLAGHGSEKASLIASHRAHSWSEEEGNIKQGHAMATGKVREPRTVASMRGSGETIMEKSPFSVPFPETNCVGKSGRRWKG